MKIISDNRRGLHGYKILETYECGLVLEGWEVKSARNQNVNLAFSYCFFRKNELFIHNANFKSYMLQKNDENRERKLLMHKNELIRLETKLNKLQSSTIIPTKIYLNNKNLIKIEIALVIGLNKSDKREAIKKKDNEMYIKKSKLYY
ncbi:SsrA-binding protein [Mycoplasmopsis meleagridis]|uniref:SsrA-binding protein n=1 Tax=Mycoplasmopsis meleagridis TaxID=29561 RepID=UPI00073D9AD4|nr:SsrA-binding protein [Mycoplasmopsis meleagridis]KUH47562.1 SsrA-binding protein [Mycoplasmopsis meleagridis]